MKKGRNALMQRFNLVSILSALFLVLTSTVAFSQETPEAFVEKGKAALAANNLTEAQVNFDKAAKMTKSKNTDVLNAIAAAWIANPKLAQNAKPVLEKSINVKPTVQAKLMLGDLYLSQGNGGPAISNYEDAAGLDPKSAIPHYKIGTVYLRSTNRDAALQAFKKAVEVDPNYGPANKELGELYYTNKDGAAAVAAQEKYITTITDEKEKEIANVKLAYYVLMTKDFAKSNQLFESLYSKGALKEQSLKYYANSLVQSGDAAKARTLFEEYFSKVKPDQIEAGDYKLYSDVLLKLADVSKDSVVQYAAVGAMDSSLKRDDKQLNLRQQKADLLYKLRKYSEAAKAYEELIAARAEGKATSADLYNLGRAVYYSANFQKADTIFGKLAEAQPALPIGYQWQGRARAQQDESSEKGLAKTAYEKVIEVGSADPVKFKKELIEGQSYLGYYYYIKNDIANSKKAWTAVLALDPNDERALQALKAINKATAAPKKPNN